MNRPRILLLSFAAALIGGCGAGTPDQPAGQGSPSRVSMQLDQPLTDAALREAARTRDSSRRSSADLALPPALSIDPEDREAVRVLYNGHYSLPAGPMNWTGNYALGTAGTVGDGFQDATVRRLNWYRAMAGVPAMVGLSREFSVKAQHAALMMSANGMLSHYPQVDWKLYSPLGAEGAANSNLALVNTGANAIDAYIQDYGGTNYFVGHRRHLLRPQLRTIGSGDVPAMQVGGVSYPGANALWVSDGTYGATRPPVRDGYVAWPTKGYTPYQTVFRRWSFSLPDANFSAATVTVSKGGVPLAAALEPVLGGYGENTLVWTMPDAPAYGAYTKPAADVRYTVTISNIVVAGRQVSHSYDVVMFDPASPTPGQINTSLTAPVLVSKGQAYEVRVAPMAAATGDELVEYRRKVLAQVFGTDTAATDWIASNGGAHAMVAGAQFRFRQSTSDFGPQRLNFARKLLVAPGGTVAFTLATGYATTDQVFHVQVSLDDGQSWQDAYTRPGPAGVLEGARPVSVSLDAFRGQHLRLRLMSDVAPGSSAYIDDASGWSVSGISFNGVDELLDERRQASVDGSFALAAGAPGRLVYVARAQYQSSYYGGFGPAAFTDIDGAVLRGPRSSYTITRNGAAIVIVDNRGADGTQTVQQPFRIDFTDLTLAFDIDGNAGKAYRLYRAAFKRAPDTGGLGFWIAALDGGLPLAAMAGGFTGSAEFKLLYGAAPTHAQIITAAYLNVLHRAPDNAGLAFWLAQMQGGMSADDLLLSFSESAENKTQVAAEVALGIAYLRP